MLTDSGGLQEETMLATLSRDFEQAIALRESGKALPRPAPWDGRASGLVADALTER